MDNVIVTVIEPQHSKNVPQNPKSVDKRTLKERDEKQYNINRKERRRQFLMRRTSLRDAGHKPGARALKCKRCGVLAKTFEGAKCSGKPAKKS